MKNIKVFCPAKINLSLNVGKKRADGFHEIDSIMQSINLGDFMNVSLRGDNNINLTFSSKEIDVANNSVLKAVSLVKEHFGDFGADIAVKKNIPLSGGLGGSSANAAGVLFALDKLLNLPHSGISIAQIAAKVGSDVPFMLLGGTARVTGIGQNIAPLKNNLPLFLVIARKKGDAPACCSGTIYALFDVLACNETQADNTLIAALLKNSDFNACKMFSNALASAAMCQNPFIKSTLAHLGEANGALCANVSGSGDCVYACFATAELAQKAAKSLSDCEAYVCRFIDCGVKIVQ